MPSGSIDYDLHAAAYPLRRSADPHVAAHIHTALAGTRTVLNVGAGTGSYEPQDRYVLAVEPSAGMRAQRPSHLAPALAATAEALPFDEDAFDAAMAIATIHHWSDLVAGLREMRRVASGPVLVLTFDANALEKYWLVRDYLPETLADERVRMPAIEKIGATLGGVVSVEPISIAADCCDGFLEAYYRRPEAYMQQEVRAAQSVWPRLPAGAERRALHALEADLASGAWEERNGHLRSMPAYDGSLRLVRSLPR